MQSSFKDMGIKCRGGEGVVAEEGVVAVLINA